ncbi:hypothetical protein Val02_47790 [Virgisporangium aliadipatigenens]|uniref:Integral membrane protein n=1 Tax=Virgisporangium aliadipatigenens TaxID=741659 RepID=A0A8J4DSH8_9ACTN|nr:hypothetical protein [Virgisporangium aliadipatigenens]GIJ47893.1 hypothetical protein Val02_47790 [Virgisporangium aliadipatigenens]
MSTTDPATVRELHRLRTELSQARAELDTRERRRETLGAVRRWAGAVLAALAAFALVASVVGVWAARTVLDTERWTATVAPLPGDPAVAAAVAEYTTTQVFAVLDVEERVRAALPEAAGFVVGPVVGQVRDGVRRTVENVVGSDRFRALWTEVNRRTHQRALAVLRGTSAVVRTDGDRVTVDLLPVVNQVIHELGARLPTVFGRQITLPDLGSGAIPPNLRTTVEEALGVSLPADFARFTVDDGGRLRAAQRALDTARRALVATVSGTLLLLVLAFVVAPGRRRVTVHFGLWLCVAAVAVTAVLRAWRADLEARVPEGVYRDGVSATISLVTQGLRERGEILLRAGALLALGAYLIGPGRLPVRLRAAIAAGGRRAAKAGTQAVHKAPQWTVEHLDAIRVGGVVVAVVAALLLASWTALLVLAVALAAFELGVTALARRTGSPRAGEATPAHVR